MKIENRAGEPQSETTVTVNDEELVDLLQGLADVIEGDRPHLHFSQPGGPQLVIKRTQEDDADPLGRQMDWWLGPAVFIGALFLIIGLITFVRWAAGLIT